jgi:hypothetical protein
MLALPLAAASAGPNEPSAPSPKSKVDGATYYLLQRATLTTDSGVRSVPTGSEVHFVQRVQGGIKVKLTDGTEMVVAPDVLTQDAKLAQQLADDERAAAAATAADIRARADARTAAETELREKEMAAAQDYLRKAQFAAPVPDATPRPWGLTGSALDERPKVTRSRKKK